MFKFNTRKQARDFAAKQPHYKPVDLGADTIGKRWAVKVIR